MCGIIGYIGDKKASQIIYDGLLKLEYRGYDSSGMCCQVKNKFYEKKDIGKLKDIHKKHNLTDLPGTKGIGHNRWATHGQVTKENAHPISSMGRKFQIVHNGVIDNFTKLKNELIEKKYSFQTSTDTEVIANLLDLYYKETNDIKKTLKQLIQTLDGSFSLVIMCSDFPDLLFAIKQKSPLVLGIKKNEFFIASDVVPLIKHTKDIIYLDNQEIVIAGKDFYEIYDAFLNRIQKKIIKIDWDAESSEKKGFEHYMLKEIFDQPEVITNIINNYVDIKNQTVNFDINEAMKKKIMNAKKFTFIACGTSWHASLMGEFIIEEILRIPSEVEYASEFRYRNPIIEDNTVYIAVSQSGETADTLAAIEELKQRSNTILSIINVPNSSIDRIADESIYTLAGIEIGVASTKAFIAQIIILYLFMLYLGQEKKILSKETITARIRDLRLLPSQTQNILEDINHIKSIANQYYKKNNAIYLGRGINFPIALEGALKLKEISYIHAEGYPAAELKHGPIALIDKHMPIFVIATKDTKVYKKLKGNLEEVKARNGEIIAITTQGDKSILQHIDKNIHIPQNSYLLTPILSVIPLQLLSYYITVLRQFDPDKPRNLAKSVTVE